VSWAAFLLVFGLQWLRKAVLRAAGLKATHDELATFREETGAALGAGARGERGCGSTATTPSRVSFKGVLLEASRSLSSCSA